MAKDTGQSKVHRVMHEWKEGKLHSGSKKGPAVTDQKQAIAIAMSEANKERDQSHRRAGARYPRV